MTDYEAIISQIGSATTTAEISSAVSSYSALAVGSGGILYTGRVGNTQAHDIAKSIVGANSANGVTVNIIDNTPRGLLLSDPGVENAILTTAQRIYSSQGMSAAAAASAAQNLLFGGATVPAGQEGSVVSSLWGQASSAFAGSLSGDVTVIGTAQQANSLRTFASVELPALLNNPSVESVGGVAVSDLKAAGPGAFSMAFNGFQSVLSSGGLYAAADGTGPALTQPALETLGFSEAAGHTAAELAAAGLGGVATSAAETGAADLLSLAGGAALKFLGGAVGGAVVNLLTSSSPTNAGEDNLLAQKNDYSDLPVSPAPLGTVATSNGNTTIQLPYNQLAANGDSINLTIGANSGGISNQSGAAGHVRL